MMDTREVAAYLRLKERRVYDLVRNNTLPHIRATGKLLFPKAQIDAWLAAKGGAPARRSERGAADHRRQPRPIAGMGGTRFALRARHPRLRQQRGPRPARTRRSHHCGDALARCGVGRVQPAAGARAHGRGGRGRHRVGQARAGTAARRRQSAQDQDAGGSGEEARPDRAAAAGGREPASVPAPAGPGRASRTANFIGWRALALRRPTSRRQSTTAMPMPA